MQQLRSKPFIFPHTLYNLQSFRTFVDDVDIKFIRDRGLDHVVEKERDLKPLLNLKNLLNSEPSKSLPLSSIVDSKSSLQIPFRPVEFIRKYPFVFEEYFPGNVGIHPHVRLSELALEIDAEERLIYRNDLFRKNAAERLLRLLMLCRANEVPLSLVDLLKFDLGLPDDYVDSLVPKFPDFFRVKRTKGRGGDEGLLELVCWREELAVSMMEKMARKGDEGYEKGMPIEFPMKFTKGYVMEKKLKKWIDEWQTFPYYSPYENFRHLQPNSDGSDRWAVAVLHELLHILVPKKTERDNVLSLGEFWGIRSRLKRAMGHHPGIFYLSSKNRTYTVVLREGYKRGLLIDKDPLMDMRNKYIHLMHKEVQKSKNVASSNTSASKQQLEIVAGVTEMEVREDEKEHCEEMQFSDSDVDVIVKDDAEADEDDEEEDEEEKQVRGSLRSGRRVYDKVNEGQEARGGPGGRRGFNNVNEDKTARGGHRGGSRGFSKGDEQARGVRGSGRRGCGKENEEDQARGGRRSEGRGSGEEQARGGRVSGGRRYSEEQGRGGHRSRGRGFGKPNEEKQARGGQGSGRKGSGMVNEGTRKPRENRWAGKSPSKHHLER